MSQNDPKELLEAIDRLRRARVRIGNIFRWDSDRVNEYVCQKNTLQIDMSLVASALVDSLQGDTNTAFMIVEIIRKCNVNRK